MQPRPKNFVDRCNHVLMTSTLNILKFVDLVVPAAGIAIYEAANQSHAARADDPTSMDDSLLSPKHFSYAVLAIVSLLLFHKLQQKTFEVNRTFLDVEEDCPPDIHFSAETAARWPVADPFTGGPIPVESSDLVSLVPIGSQRDSKTYEPWPYEKLITRSNQTARLFSSNQFKNRQNQWVKLDDVILLKGDAFQEKFDPEFKRVRPRGFIESLTGLADAVVDGINASLRTISTHTDYIAAELKRFRTDPDYRKHALDVLQKDLGKVSHKLIEEIAEEIHSEYKTDDHESQNLYISLLEEIRARPDAHKWQPMIISILETARSKSDDQSYVQFINKSLYAITGSLSQRSSMRK